MNQRLNFRSKFLQEISKLDKIFEKKFQSFQRFYQKVTLSVEINFLKPNKYETDRLFEKKQAGNHFMRYRKYFDFLLPDAGNRIRKRNKKGQ
jgi:hypothetical protein